MERFPGMILVILLATSTVLSEKPPKTKRPPAVLSNDSFRNLTAAPLLPGELNTGDGDTNMTPRDIQRTVDRHNEHRKNERASDMQHMTWDPTLATMAQRWADRCVFEHGYDDNISPYESVGQNLWLRPGDPNKPVSGVIATDDWHAEIDDYHYDSDTCYAVCGHYTQVVWAESNKIGCGLAYCGWISGYQNAWNMVCNYGPAGNFYGQKPYKTGEVCSDCPPATPFCFNGLCRLCNLDEAGCSCPLTCQNCGVLNRDKCYCDCPNGFHGSTCAYECVDTHHQCWANPGWPGPFACSWDPIIPKGCPKMCGVCQERDPGFTCDPNQPGPQPPRPSTPASLCNTAFDSVAMINGELNVVKGKKYWRFDTRGNLLSEPSGELLKNYHSTIKKGVKGLYQIGTQGQHKDTISMIRGKKMWRFASDRRRLSGWPRNLYKTLGISSPIVAAVHDERYGVTYMLTAKTSNVYQYDENYEALVQNYPVAINEVFRGLPVKITAAFRLNGKFYFLRGKKVYQVNENTMSVEGAPANFAESFLGC